MTIVEFLLARLDEDEATASCITAWVIHPETKLPAYQSIRPRVLAEVKAQRAIVERAQFVDDHGPAVDHVRALDMSTGAAAALRDVLSLLALPYADHEDFDVSWRP